MNSISTFNAIAPPDGHYVYEQETDTFSLIDEYYVNDTTFSVKIPKNTKFTINEGDMVCFNIRVPIFLFLNYAVNNFRAVYINLHYYYYFFRKGI